LINTNLLTNNMKNLFLITLFIVLGLASKAQGDNVSFINFQRTLSRPSEALKRKADTLQKQFEAKGLTWPAKDIYIRSFKYDSQLEVWVRNDHKEPFKLFKTYRVCALAGSLGPKRMKGDYQVPEGFYYINEFNPNSTYYLSLGLNYPNASDRILSDSVQPGGDIYIHGSCVTVGCIPITDQQIDEVYIMAAYAKDAGQDFIPVHIYPVRYNNKKSAAYLAEFTKTDKQLKNFAETLESVYDHFELTHKLPVIMVNANGDYVFSNLSKKVPPPPPPVKQPVQHRTRNITNVAESVTQWPQFSGGNQEFLGYLAKMGKVLSGSLPAGMKKAYVQVEFIVDTDGVPVNFKMIKGVNSEFDEELITVLEQMPAWQPAMINDKPVAKQMKQGFAIE
jgi:murein L,D-transpeptidase YafK